MLFSGAPVSTLLKYIDPRAYFSLYAWGLKLSNLHTDVNWKLPPPRDNSGNDRASGVLFPPPALKKCTQCTYHHSAESPCVAKVRWWPCYLSKLLLSPPHKIQRRWLCFCGWEVDMWLMSLCGLHKGGGHKSSSHSAASSAATPALANPAPGTQGADSGCYNW